jgi:nicotinamidase-related amidase
MVPTARGNAFLVKADDALLVLIDLQEKLVPVIAEKERVLENVLRLVRFAAIVGLPAILTEQERLGPTLPELRKELPTVQPIPKVHFNCFYCQEFKEAVARTGRRSLVLAGAEAHICVAQTALYALPRFNVHILTDAISSRTLQNRDMAISRLAHSGAVLTSTEMFIYEILEKAGTENFRAALRLVK